MTIVSFARDHSEPLRGPACSGDETKQLARISDGEGIPVGVIGNPVTRQKMYGASSVQELYGILIRHNDEILEDCYHLLDGRTDRVAKGVREAIEDLQDSRVDSAQSLATNAIEYLRNANWWPSSAARSPMVPDSVPNVSEMQDGGESPRRLHLTRKCVAVSYK